MRRRGRGPRDDRGGTRPRAQGDARVQGRRDERRDRSGGSSRPGGGVGGSRWQSAHHRRSLPRRRRRKRAVRLSRSAGTGRDPSVVTSHRVEVAVFAIALTVFGLVALALVWSGDWAYVALANLGGGPSRTILIPRVLDGSRVESPADLALWLGWHHVWAAYVTNLTSTPPISWGTG